MNTYIFSKPKALKKALSLMAIFGLLLGGVSGLVYSRTAEANNGVNTYAVPNTGTLSVGDTLEVHMTVGLDPNDTNPVTSPSCFVNGVDVTSTYSNQTTGTNGHFVFTYTVGAGDTNRAAGQVPINCTLQQTGSVTITGFDDGNSVAIDVTGDTGGGDTGGGDTGGQPGDGLTAGSDGIITYFDPNSGTLNTGDSLALHLKVGLDPNDTNPVTSPSCFVNGIDVASSFSNQTVGTNGHFVFTYTVGAGDTDRIEGQVPVSCTLQQTGAVTVTDLDDSNTLSIDAGSTGGSSLSISEVSVSPNSGTVTAGDTVEVFLREAGGATDLAVTGLCHVNAVASGSTLTHLGGGLYKLTYTVGANDGERPAGHMPIGCTLGNSSGNVTAGAWTDGNTLSVDTNDDGSIDNGTNTLGFTVVANPSSGTLNVGDSLQVDIQDPLPSGDVVIGSAGCRVNDVDVSGSYTYQGNGLYRVTYTVGESNANRAAGEIPFDCTLQNHTGSVHLVAFTDNNTVAVDTSSTGGGDTGGGDTGGDDTTPGTGAGLTAGSDGIITYFDPISGTLNTGESAALHLKVTLDPNDTNPVTSPSCFVNGVNVANTFSNQTTGIDGHFVFTYTVGSNDTDRSAGQIPVSCTLQQTGSVTVTALDDSNTLAVDAGTTNTGGNTGGNSTSTAPIISIVAATPSTGTLTPGQTLVVDLQESHGMTGMTVGACTINNVNVAGTFQSFSSGSYRVTYTVAAGDTDRAAGQVPISCTLTSTSSQSVTASAFTDSNTVAIIADPDYAISPEITDVSIIPSSGTLSAATTSTTTTSAEIRITANKTELVMGNSCTVNNVDVRNTFQNLGGGLYSVTYTAANGHSDRASGTIPVNCTLSKSTIASTTTATAFTDGNTLAIDINGDGIFGTSTGTTTNTGGNNTGTTTNTGGNNTGTTTNSGGNNTGTTTATTTLGVTGITSEESVALAGGGFNDGWVWVLNITVPENETSLQARFANWTGPNGATIAAAGNMRISSAQATSSDAFTITAANTYGPTLLLTGDLDPNTAGRQIQLRVEMQVPAGTANGSYSTSYGIRSFE